MYNDFASIYSYILLKLIIFNHISVTYDDMIERSLLQGTMRSRSKH